MADWHLCVELSDKERFNNIETKHLLVDKDSIVVTFGGGTWNLLKSHCCISEAGTESLDKEGLKDVDKSNSDILIVPIVFLMRGVS